jgi:hypothetical protein
MKLKHEVHIAAPASEAWHVLGLGFGTICEWSATLASSELVGELGVGAARRCQGTGFGPFAPSLVTEELTSFDPQGMRFRYVARTGLPGFLRHAENAWSIHPVGSERCRVEFHATVRPAWWAWPIMWALPRLLRADIAKMSEEMKHRIERGTPHPRTLAATT